jgi:type II secretory pathway pseudopilin PulG
MKKRHSSKGLLPIALTFVLVIAVVLATILIYFWSKAPYTVQLLKRTQAINYAEAGLYEAFNRFRDNTWDADGWADDTWAPLPGNDIIDVDGVPVTISVVLEGGRNRVSATVDYGDVRL